MSVFRRGRIYHYKFRLKGKPYRGTTGLTNEDDAIEFEDELKRKIRRRSAGLAALPEHSPRFQDWAEVYYQHAKKKLKRPDRVEDLLRVVLRFFGARPSGKNPKNPPIEGEPYHDLRLGDLIDEPQWILDFETWMNGRTAETTGRALAGQTKNQYRSTVSRMYALAMSPLHRKATGITMNPMAGVERDRKVGRTVTIAIEDIRRVLAAASYHVRIACAIAILAPKFRLANILGLKWDEHVDLGPRTVMVGKKPVTIYGWIRMWEHKTDGSGRALVQPVVRQLFDILVDARKRNPRSDYVVTYRGGPVTKIRDGVRRACIRADVAYGRFVAGGATFHTLRHTTNTTLAELDITETKRQQVAGHADLATTQWYTHLTPTAEIVPLEELSDTIPIADLVTVPWKRASGGTVPTSAPTRH